MAEDTEGVEDMEAEAEAEVEEVMEEVEVAEAEVEEALEEVEVVEVEALEEVAVLNSLLNKCAKQLQHIFYSLLCTLMHNISLGGKRV